MTRLRHIADPYVYRAMPLCRKLDADKLFLGCGPADLPTCVPCIKEFLDLGEYVVKKLGLEEMRAFLNREHEL